MDTQRVLIADDHEAFRKGLEALLAAAPAIEVVGTAADGAMAVALALDLQPDVVLMDLHMPRVNGIDATAQIVASSPHIGVLVLTMMEDEESVFAAVRAGARGFLLKGARRAEITRAVQAVGAGEVIFGPGIADRVMTYFAGVRSRPVADAFPDDSWGCRSRRCATTPATSSPSSRSPTGPRRSSRRARRASGSRGRPQPLPSRHPPWRRTSSRASAPTARACSSSG
jgi:DNA-binding NarL/FixJ family response regulator